MMKLSTTSTTCYLAVGIIGFGSPSLTSSQENRQTIKYKKEENKKITTRIELSKWITDKSSLKKEEIIKKIEVKKSKELLIESLNKFNWRTIAGILAETEIPKNEIVKELKEMADSKLIFIGTEGSTHEKIYTSIKNYEKNTKFRIKFLDSVRGKIIR